MAEWDIVGMKKKSGSKGSTSSTSATICSFYVKGMCTFGNACRHVHPGSTRGSQKSGMKEGAISQGKSCADGGGKVQSTTSFPVHPMRTALLSAGRDSAPSVSSSLDEKIGVCSETGVADSSTSRANIAKNILRLLRSKPEGILGSNVKEDYIAMYGEELECGGPLVPFLLSFRGVDMVREQKGNQPRFFISQTISERARTERPRPVAGAGTGAGKAGEELRRGSGTSSSEQLPPAQFTSDLFRESEPPPLLPAFSFCTAAPGVSPALMNSPISVTDAPPASLLPSFQHLSMSMECGICLAAVKSVVFLPCRHLACCSSPSCGMNLAVTQCIICRSDIQDRFEIFL